MPETDTWESASTTPPLAPPVGPVVAAEPPVESEPAPAEAVTLEKPEAPQVEPAEATARESEAPEQIAQPETPKPDEYIPEADDPPELAALPTPAAKRWAKRQHKDAAAIRAFDDFGSPISDVGDQLYARSASRYTEHVNDLLTRHQDYASKQLFGVPYAEAKARLQSNGTPATTPTPESGVSIPTAEEIAQMDNEQVVQRMRDVQLAAEAKIRAEFDEKLKPLQSQLEDVNGKLTTREQQAQQAEIQQKQTEIYTQVWSSVDEVIRNSGLEANPLDPPKIASLKEAARELIKNNAEPAFDAVDENKKIVGYVVEATNRREFGNAEREIDNLKVRARAAAESVKSTAKVKAILDEIEAYANQSNGKSRAPNPIPPAPGSSVGVHIKPPATWDEAERLGA